MKQMKEIHSTAHWEPMRGTVDQAAEYCKKEGEWFEAGVRPLNQKKKVNAENSQSKNVGL